MQLEITIGYHLQFYWPDGIIFHQQRQQWEWVEIDFSPIFLYRNIKSIYPNKDNVFSSFSLKLQIFKKCVTFFRFFCKPWLMELLWCQYCRWSLIFGQRLQIWVLHDHPYQILKFHEIWRTFDFTVMTHFEHLSSYSARQPRPWHHLSPPGITLRHFAISSAT